MMLLFMLSFGWVIAKEVTLLLAEFGEEYREYRRVTWRLIPFVY